jgi:hypothetical protein
MLRGAQVKWFEEPEWYLAAAILVRVGRGLRLDDERADPSRRFLWSEWAAELLAFVGLESDVVLRRLASDVGAQISF